MPDRVIRSGRPVLWRLAAAPVLIFVVVAVYGAVANNGYSLEVGTNIAVAAISVIGLTLVIGGAGQLALGQAGFMGLGGYTVAYLTRDQHVTFLLALVAAALLNLVAGTLVGYIALRLRGNYLAMATLASGAIIFGLLTIDSPLGGTNGFPNIPPVALGPLTLSSPRPLYIFTWGLVALVYLGSLWLMNSRTGRELQALRDDEVGSASIGVNITYRKIQIFAISAVLGGIAGGLEAAQQSTVSPGSFSPDVSLQLFIMAVIGGLGSAGGAIFGTALVLWLLQLVPGTGNYALTALGVLVIVIMIAFPEGFAAFLAPANPRSIWGMARSRLAAEQGNKPPGGPLPKEQGSG